MSEPSFLSLSTSPSLDRLNVADPHQSRELRQRPSQHSQYSQYSQRSLHRHQKLSRASSATPTPPTESPERPARPVTFASLSSQMNLALASTSTLAVSTVSTVSTVSARPRKRPDTRGHSGHDSSPDCLDRHRDRPPLTHRHSTAGMPSSVLPIPPDEPYYHHRALAAPHTADEAMGTGPWRPDSAISTQSSSPNPLLSRLARGAGRQRPQSESPSGRPARSLDRRTGSSSSGYRSYSANSNIGRYATTRNASISSGAPPPLTREEFEALPVAIQRKYFSTLERLRFAQDSGIVDGICQHYDAISAQNLKRRKPRQHRSASEHITGRLRRRSLREPFLNDSLLYAALPEKIKKREFTREEQVLLAGQLRTSVILDAADEAVYRIGRRASTHHLVPAIHINSPPLSSRSMETVQSGMQSDMPAHLRQRRRGPIDLSTPGRRVSGVPDSFYDSFRWVEEDEDLDLRLFLDDYHANLREALPQKTGDRQPTFRRHMSVSKIPFSLPSTEPSRPATNATTGGISSSAMSVSPSPGSSPFPAMSSAVTPSPSPPIVAQHSRRKSRTLSLITPKHASRTSISSIDPSAAHYQDPEARLKLRVYLASPQKFDEAIEFGFPSTDGFSGAVAAAGVQDADATKPRRMDWQHSGSGGATAVQTFLDDDDDDRLEADQSSVADPESPRTPNNLMESTATNHGTRTSSVLRPFRLSSAEPISHGHRATDSYAQVPASSREMTLRMTLTRPDLRACEDQIYGWQQSQQPPVQIVQAQPSSGRKSMSPLHDDAVTLVGGIAGGGVGPGRPKESIDQAFGGIDHWGPDPPEKGVMRRFWHRMRRS